MQKLHYEKLLFTTSLNTKVTLACWLEMMRAFGENRWEPRRCSQPHRICLAYWETRSSIITANGERVWMITHSMPYSTFLLVMCSPTWKSFCINSWNHSVLLGISCWTPSLSWVKRVINVSNLSKCIISIWFWFWSTQLHKSWFNIDANSFAAIFSRSSLWNTAKVLLVMPIPIQTQSRLKLLEIILFPTVYMEKGI